jgi:hypothetical protein
LSYREDATRRELVLQTEDISNKECTADVHKTVILEQTHLVNSANVAVGLISDMLPFKVLCT